MATKAPAGGELTSVEQSLVDHVSRGETLDLAADNEEIDEAAMRSWGDSRICRASVIRDILRGRLAADPDPHGLQLRGARITGRIDLDSLTTDLDFELTDCLLEEGLVARDARLFTLVLTGCHLEHPAEPPLAVDRLTCSLIYLHKVTIIGHVESGALSLAGAHIAGPLICTTVSLDNDSGSALDASGLQTGQDLILTGGCTATGTGESGAVNLFGAHVGGILNCDGASLGNDSGPALQASGLQVDQGMFLTDGFTATGAGEYGAVSLIGAHVGGSLNCDGASLRNDSGPALHANSLQVEQGMLLTGGFTATGAGESGAVNLIGAHVGSSLNCDGASLRNDSGPALHANSLQVEQGMLLTGGFTATGAGESGAVNLIGTHVGGQLFCTGVRLRNDSGPALNANSLRADQGALLTGGGFTGAGESGAVSLASAHLGRQLVCTGASLRNDSGPAMDANGLQADQGMYLRGGFTAIGAGASGAISLASAHVGGQLDCTGASLRNDSGPALNADGLQADQGMYLRGGFTAIGAGASGALSLAIARLGRLDCTGASLRNDSGPALNANSLQVDQSMLLRGEFTATGAGDGVAVDLADAQVRGTLEFDPAQLKHATDPQGRFAVDGLTYAGVPEPISARDWLRLLRNGTRGYAAQPYQQLAAAYRALGDERQAREILMAQRDDQLARTHPRWPEQWWGRVTKVTLGYGYQPWRALLFLTGVVALSCLLTIVLGSHGALAQTSNTATPGHSCTVLQQASVGLDLNLPIGKSVARDRCDLAEDSASVTAAWLTAAGWVLQLLAWVFAALFVAGFTSAVRKT